MALNGAFDFTHGLVELERIPAAPPLNYSLRPKDEALAQKVRQAFVTYLRQLADEWIKTGSDGPVENPRDRTLSRLEPSRRLALDTWAAENHPYLSLEHSGETVVRMPVTKIDYSSPLKAARNAAMVLFSVFLDSSFRSRLFKCLRCNVYYYTERQPQGPIKHGTYCQQHRNAASVSRSNERRRVPEHNRKLEFAAHWWGRWPKRVTEEGARAEWIANKVNGHLDHNCTTIKRNWVTRHRATIEEKASSVFRETRNGT